MLPAFLVLDKINTGLGIRLGDLWDLIVGAPFIGLTAYKVYLTIGGTSALSGTRRRILEIFIAMSFILLFEGHGMHFAANSINNLAEGSIVSSNVRDLIYFYDEILSHKILFAGIFNLLVAGNILQYVHRIVEDVSKKEVFFLVFSGFWLGVGLAFSAIEGQAPIESLIASSLIILSVYVIKVKYFSSLKKMPFLVFTLASSLAIIFVSLSYAAVLGGFIQPSEYL